LESSDYDLSFLDLEKEISFLDRSMKCCVCFVDMVNSTKVTAEISDPLKIGKYYSIFINTMAILARNYNAKIIKNAGDALIFYFPETSDSGNETAFRSVLECFTTMILSRDIINAKLRSENLPSVSYRISADYGKVEVAISTSSKSEDLFGSIMNICAKINSMAEPNGIAIGGELYNTIKSFSFFDGYRFGELKTRSSLGLSEGYPVYSSISRNTNEIGANSINQLLSSFESTKIVDPGDKRQKRHFSLQSLQQSEKKKQQQGNLLNIMIVDDEPDALLTFKYLLSAEGYRVQAFTNPQEALKHFIQLQQPSFYYRLVLLDIRMPQLNGLQLFYKIKAISPEATIMFCSALDIAEELVSILPDITYEHILKKPLKREDLINKINAVVVNNHPDLFDSSV
jgi:two-component system, OmpR family, response regulator ChvI